MSISKEMFLAILALDAYNRDYAAVISLTGTQLGNATVNYGAGIAGVDQYKVWQKNSYYALSYTLTGSMGGYSAGQKVIAYRGTDTPAGDFVTGWLAGAGWSGASQLGLAASTFEAVTGQSVSDAASLKPVVTGHSLGGGLAGYVSVLSGAAAKLPQSPLQLPIALDRYLTRWPARRQTWHVARGWPDAE